MLRLTLPVYYTKTFKTKPSKQFLVNMNWYRNAHHYEQNAVKLHYHSLVSNLIKDLSSKPSYDKYSITFTYYYKSSVSDLANVCSLMSKFVNDSLQELGIVKNDNVNFCISETYLVGTQDKQNPRVEIHIRKRG